jgi:flagellin-like protein
MRKVWAMRKNEEAVSPVIATILMVAITVVLAAVLYVLVLTLIDVDGKIGAIVLDKDSTATNWTLKVVTVSSTTQALLADVFILVTNPDMSVALSSRAISDMVPGSYYNGVRYIEAMTADTLNAGDYFTLDRSLFASGTTVSLFDSEGTTTYAQKEL